MQESNQEQMAKDKDKALATKKSLTSMINIPSGNDVTEFIKRPQVWGFFVSVAVMIIVSLAFFYPNNFSGDTLSQYDQVQGAANGAEAQAYEQATGEKALWTNSLFGGMPTFQISPSYPSNSLFTWIDTVYGFGLPAPSQLLFKMMFGFLIMCYCWRIRWKYGLIGALAWGLSSYFVIIIGAGHLWKFNALTYMPPMIGAMALVYGGKRLGGASMLGLFAMLELNANHPQITYYSAFIIIALVLGWLVTAIRQKTVRQWLVASAICLGAGVLAVGANLPSLYNTYEYSKQTKRAASELTPIAPANENDDPSTNPAKEEKPTGGLPKAEIGGWSNTASETVTLLIPNIKGGASAKVSQGTTAYMSMDKAPGVTQDMIDSDVAQLLPQLPQYFGGKMDSGSTNGPFYLGALICTLFVLGCFIVKGPVKWALLTITVFSALLAMGNHLEWLTDWMIYNFPLYNKFRAAETTLVMASFAVPLLAVMALQKFMSTPGALKTYKNDLIASFGFTMILCAIAWVWPGFFGEPFSSVELKLIEGYNEQLSQYPVDIQEQFKTTLDNIAQLRYDMISADALRSLMIIAAAGVLMILAARRSLKKAYAVFGLGLITVFDLYNVDKRYIDTESFVTDMSGFTNPLEPDDIDRTIMADKGYYRVCDFDNFSRPHRSAHHKMVGGYHAAKLNRYNDMIERNVIQRHNILDMLNTRYFIHQGQVHVNPGALGAAWLVDSLQWVADADAEMAAISAVDTVEMKDTDTTAVLQEIPRFNPAAVAVVDKRFEQALGKTQPRHTTGDEIELKEYTPNRLTYEVNTAQGGVAVFSEVYFPWGWKATVDGKETPLARVNYILRAVRVPSGKHTVVMTFDPQSIHTTASIAYGSVTLIYLLCIAALFLVVCPSIATCGKQATATQPENKQQND